MISCTSFQSKNICKQRNSRQLGLSRDCEVSVNLFSQVDMSDSSDFKPSAMESDFDPSLKEEDTPILSESGESLWPPNKQQILLDHIAYHDSMAIYLTSALSEGQNIDKPMPKPPKSKLKDVFGPHQSKPQPLFGEELQTYLIKHLVNHAQINQSQWNPTSLENIKIKLQEGFHILKQKNAALLWHYIRLGHYLIHAFDYFSIAKLRNDVPQNTTWKQWLKDNIGMSDSYDRKLRDLAKTFNQYTRFRYLGISIKEFLKIKEQIRLMFITYPAYADFWKQNIPP